MTERARLFDRAQLDDSFVPLCRGVEQLAFSKPISTRRGSLISRAVGVRARSAVPYFSVSGTGCLFQHKQAATVSRAGRSRCANRALFPAALCSSGQRRSAVRKRGAPLE